jgi:FOG: Transposase and inactivated derivatives
LKRDDSTSVSKDAAMRVLVAAANKNQFVNDAAKNLDLKEWYDGDEVPTGKTLNYHIQRSSRKDITRMFIKANEPLFEIADDHDYFEGGVEVAIDLTDWPFFGDPDVDDYVRKTKSERNHWQAWKFIVLSLVGTDTSFILGVLPVRKKKLTPKYMRRLLRLASQYVDVQRVYVDAATEFYSDDAISTVDELGMELVMQGRRSGSNIKHLLNGMARSGLDSEYMSYGAGSLNPEGYWAVGVKSKKITKLREAEPDEPLKDYVYLYTNVDPTEVPPEELANDYRRRWGIETGFRNIKHDFLPKSGSPSSEIRTFYFNFAAYLYNIWTAANIRRADALDNDLSEKRVHSRAVHAGD